MSVELKSGNMEPSTSERGNLRQTHTLFSRVGFNTLDEVHMFCHLTIDPVASNIHNQTVLYTK